MTLSEEIPGERKRRQWKKKIKRMGVRRNIKVTSETVRAGSLYNVRLRQ